MRDMESCRAASRGMYELAKSCNLAAMACRQGRDCGILVQVNCWKQTRIPSVVNGTYTVSGLAHKMKTGRGGSFSAPALGL